MGGKIDYAAIPIIVEILGVMDVELMMVELFAIRDHFLIQQRAK